VMVGLASVVGEETFACGADVSLASPDGETSSSGAEPQAVRRRKNNTMNKAFVFINPPLKLMHPVMGTK
jgi:hypothetical protein